MTAAKKIQGRSPESGSVLSGIACLFKENYTTPSTSR